MFHTFFFFFKQKTAYEMRISDWSSDVCSSDLHAADEQIAIAEKASAEITAEQMQSVVERTEHAHHGGRVLDRKFEVLGRVQHQRRIQNRESQRRKDLDEEQRAGACRNPREWGRGRRSEEHTSELQSLMRIPYAV